MGSKKKQSGEGVGLGWGLREIEIREVLSTATSRQIANHKMNKKKTSANNSVKKLLGRGS